MLLHVDGLPAIADRPDEPAPLSPNEDLAGIEGLRQIEVGGRDLTKIHQFSHRLTRNDETRNDELASELTPKICVPSVFIRG